MTDHTLLIPQIGHNARIGDAPTPAQPTEPPSADVTQTIHEARIVELMRSHPSQKRPMIEVHPILQRVARYRASDMLERGYFAHTDLAGRGPNWHATQAGYKLPPHYDHAKDGNNIESIASGYRTVDEVWAAWLDSPGHRMHLLAELDFFAEQVFVGVGVVITDEEARWVVLSAPASGVGQGGLTRVGT